MLVLSFGSALLVNVSLGPMAAEIGAASVLVWIVTAFVGLIQCLLIAELAGRYPNKVGGVPAYIHEGLKHRSPLFGAVAAWAYWSGWIPGVAVHLVLAATYIRAAFWPDANIVGAHADARGARLHLQLFRPPIRGVDVGRAGGLRDGSSGRHPRRAAVSQRVVAGGPDLALVRERSRLVVTVGHPADDEMDVRRGVVVVRR